MNINQVEAEFSEIQSAYENREISREEYLNLLQGLEVEQAIAEDAEELSRKENLNSMINAAITTVSMLG